VGPHPLYYTHHYNKMIKPNGYTVTGVAKETKKSKTVIRDGLRLKELSGVARKALRDSKINKSIGALIVTIPDKKQQDKFAKEVLTGGQHGEPMSVRKAKEWKQQHYMKELKGAPFPLDQQIDPSWPHSCLTCPHFNGNTPERRQGKRSDICLNPPHYKEQERLYEMRVSAKTKE